ncbi:stalk domain-containing protein [Cohnella suwonensis]|uniref:Stalk domain-containing protein n=1 Tax=Cohnella suwonensis TaxID=696072 RepID=A0ABW0LWI8_9BACL
MKYVKRAALLFVAAMLAIQLPHVANADAQADFLNKVEGAVILYIGSPNAIVDLSDEIIDEDNFTITPYTSNNRTLVPLRFIGESLGAAVKWDNVSSTVTLQGNNRTINMKLNSTQMSVNGSVKKLEAAATYKSGRVFVPLRAISEAFGKKVSFARGVIMISDTQVINPTQDMDIVQYLIDTLLPFHKDAYTGRALTTEHLASMDQSVVILEAFDKQGISIGFGSAFAIGYGLYLTNYHVIDQASSYLVETEQDRFYDVEGVVDVDPDHDLAIVKTSIRTNVPPMHIGTSSTGLTKGQSIVTIGNPEGLQNTISTGVISGFRSNPSLIQISAPITHGNSGGPLLNIKGEVIGVTSSGVEESGNLNFAIPIDFAKEAVKYYASLPFTNIPVMDQHQFEAQVNTDPGTADPSPSPEPSLSPSVGNPVTLPTEDVHVLNRAISVMVPDPSSSIVYMADDTQKKVIAFDYASDKEIAVSAAFDKPVRKLAFANGELYVMMSDQDYSPYTFDGSQGGTIAVLHPGTLQLKDQWRTRIDPYDIAIDKVNHVYVASGSGQWTYILSYDRTTHEEISSRSIRNASNIALHPAEDKIYAIDTDSSPRDMKVYTIGNGLFTGDYDSPYHGDYPLTTSMGITPDGKYVLNGYGGIFSSTNMSTTNMRFVAKTDPFDMMAGDPLHPETYFTARQSTVRQYDTDTMSRTKLFNTNGTLLQIAEAHGQFIALTKVAVKGSAVPKFALEITEI